MTPPKISIEERFWSHVNKRGPKHPELGHCWQWKLRPSSNGYGSFSVNNHPVLVHRWAYKFLVGPIPEGLTIDHLCRNRMCVRPSHLEPVTQAENNRRSIRHAIERIKCKKGHLFTQGKNQKHCRTCKAESSRQYRQTTQYRQNRQRVKIPTG